MKQTTKQKEPFTFDFSIPIVGAIVMLLLALTSCSRDGYGCKGNSKIMTRVR